MQYNTIQYKIQNTKYNTIQYNTIQYNTIQEGNILVINEGSKVLLGAPGISGKGKMFITQQMPNSYASMVQEL